MNINYRKQSQFELFPKASEDKEEPEQAGFEIKNIILTPENLIVCAIVLVMVQVLFFSFGVERGKRLSRAVDSGEQINSLHSAKSGIIGASQIEAQEESLSVKTPEDTATESVIQEPIPVDEAIPEDYYTIQVASFKLEKNARKEAESLEEFGYETYVMGKGSHSIVCVGKFMQRQEARDFSLKLKNKYRDSLVRRM